jgi:hypothetical protein
LLLEVVNHPSDWNDLFVSSPIDFWWVFWIGKDTKREMITIFIIYRSKIYYLINLTNLLKYLSLLPLNAMKFVFCVGGTRSAMAAQLIDDAAMRLEAIFPDFP